MNEFTRYINEPEETVFSVASPDGHVNINYVQGYTIQSNAVQDCEDLSLAARWLYGFLAQYVNGVQKAFPKVSMILKKGNFSKPTFYKARTSLVEWGLIQVKTVNTKHGRRTAYYIPTELDADTKIVQWLMRQASTNTQSSGNENDEILLLTAEDFDALDEDADTIIEDLSSEKLSTNTSSEPWSKIFTMASEECGKPQPDHNILCSEKSTSGTHGQKFLPCNNYNYLNIYPSIHPSGSVPVAEPPADPTDLAAEPKTAAPSQRNGMDGWISSIESDLTDPRDVQALHALASSQLKPIGSATEPKVIAAYRDALTQGYSPTSIAEAYGAYRRTYLATNDTTQYAMNLARWLTEPGGLTAYAKADKPALDAEAAPLGKLVAASDDEQVKGWYVELTTESEPERQRALASRIRNRCKKTAAK